ncbi:uncharacterized protein J3D65DRAFT_621522 [Phyllosticta citribraziliensis]|uniref:Uncharacterized protein n=1 Tax=Phyllosticta citribraziliensis TaxID=989973 RepID=A0ABR1LSY1_9PEZI
MRDLSTLVYFVAHDIHRADMEQILHKHPAHSFEYLWMERSNVRAVQTMQTTALTYMKKLVEETYEQKMADHTDITRMSNANRRDNLWVPMWRKDKMTLVKGMYGSMDKVIDFEVILDPPNDLDDELARKLQAWRTYLMWCFILSAEASLKMQLVPEYLGRATGGVPQGESVYNHWKRLVREDYIIIPDLKTLPVTSGKDAANKRRKVAVKTGHSFVPITGLQG